MSKAHQIVGSAVALARSLWMFVSERLLGRGMDRETARALPGPMYVGVAAERHSHATTRWRDSGYDDRLFPYAWPDEATQRNYDLYDAWANRGYEDDSEYWPPRTLRGRLLHGRDAHGKPAVSQEGWEGYSPDPMRLSVWGINGHPARGTGRARDPRHPQDRQEGLARPPARRPHLANRLLGGVAVGARDDGPQLALLVVAY